MFIDSRTEATRPAGVQVRWLHYWRYDRQPWILALFGVVLGGWLYVSSRQWLGVVMLVAVAAVFLLHVRYVRQRFAGGMLCASITLTSKPMLVASLTNLGSGPDIFRPVVKVFSVPSSMEQLPPGTRVATVTLYSGQTEALHWNDCHPVLARAVDESSATEISLLTRIPAEEWAELMAAIETLQRPFKAGLFPVRSLERSNSPTSSL